MDEGEVAAILACAGEVAGVDFTSYQPSTVSRRVAHRMRMRDRDTAAGYLALLDDDRGERWKLADALLIKTTRAFRDAETYRELREHALPSVLANCVRRGAHVVRAWSAGCATGEEAYGLALCLFEAIERAQVDLAGEVLATDVDAGALERAARGSFLPESLAAIPADLLARYFDHDGPDALRARATLRAAIKTARHDLLSPLAVPSTVFASFDLVSCCNVLLYFRPQPRRVALARLVDACEPGGILVLGEAELPDREIAPRLLPTRAAHVFEVRG